MTLAEAPAAEAAASGTEEDKPRTGSKAEKVIRLVRLHPEWPDSQVASVAECDPSYIAQVKFRYQKLINNEPSPKKRKSILKYGDKKKKVLEYVKAHPKATSSEIATAIGCCQTYAQQVIRERLDQSSKTKPGAFPNTHSGRKNHLDEVTKVDVHQKVGQMMGVFKSIQRLVIEGLGDIEKTIDDVSQMPENRQRIKSLLQHATILSSLLEPADVKVQNTQQEGHASVDAKVVLTKLK